VEAEIIADKVARQFAVPKSAVVRNDGKTWLFVQTPKGFTALPVTLINEQSERAIITGNFSGTEKVAVSGTVAIKAAWNGGE
jgi:hypothetical protein